MITKRQYYFGFVYLAIAAITALHYLTAPHAHQLHDIYRRLYYLPIIFAAFLGGFRGGLIAALIVCLVYIPHAFGHISHDPASPTQKGLEMVLYFAVGVTTGSLSSRLHRAQRALEGTTRDLRASLEQLRSTEEQLIHTAKLAAVGRLSAGLAHEIRNPLSSIKGSAEILADDFPAGHAKHRMLQVLIAESVRLNDVLSRFLAFARPRPLERRPVAVRPEIESVISLLQAQKEGRAVRFRLAGEAEALPSIQGDPEQLRQVWLNLLLNACQSAGEQGEVQVECRVAGGALQVRIRDSGPGFAPEALENAFTPFYTTKEQGSGLGLAVSHRIIEAHGGRILLSNNEGGGGLVELTLPL